MHMNALCTKCNLHECVRMQGNASYQNATYMNAFKCISMQYHAAREECNRMECNENVENASECSKMHKNAYGKKPHHFREKNPRIPNYSACPPVGFILQ